MYQQASFNMRFVASGSGNCADKRGEGLQVDVLLKRRRALAYLSYYITTDSISGNTGLCNNASELPFLPARSYIIFHVTSINSLSIALVILGKIVGLRST